MCCGSRWPQEAVARVSHPSGGYAMARLKSHHVWKTQPSRVRGADGLEKPKVPQFSGRSGVMRAVGFELLKTDPSDAQSE